MRERDADLKNYQETALLHDNEGHKWHLERVEYEERLSQLEADLAIASHAQSALDEQKHENLFLKETIDRMRFDMDEMRASFQAEAGKDEKGIKSQPNTISRSLGAEIDRAAIPWINNVDWEREEGISVMADTTVDAEVSINSGDTLVVQEEEKELFEGASEAEDIIETIITRKTRVSDYYFCALSLMWMLFI